jgi:hypothetical protein
MASPLLSSLLYGSRPKNAADTIISFSAKDFQDSFAGSERETFRSLWG